ncbi:hypothetical protein TSAR_011825 [Trichomalopsis sarcophagae]|uniref:C2H2-type domain-containing protein n=1 Tax=Trichomalopsis sarcophagae TaxID=543379 RepID=A0A232F5Z8_9HYME|nr:hypothetical protein TSAR_011825 [Trichomalopsis sarcophagae]
MEAIFTKKKLLFKNFVVIVAVVHDEKAFMNKHVYQLKTQNLSLADLRRSASSWQSWYTVPSIVWRTAAAASSGSPGSDKDLSGLSGSPDSKEFACQDCGRVYKLKSSLRNHRKWECGKEPQFQCPYCSYRAKQKMHVARHIERVHKDKLGKIERQ